MKTNNKYLKIVALVVLITLMATALSGCGFILGFGEDDLNSMMDEIAVGMLTGDGISVNILLENPEALGLQDQPASLPLPNFDKEEYESQTESIKQLASMFYMVNNLKLSKEGKCSKRTVINFFNTYAEYADFYYLSNRDYIGASDGWNVILPLYLDKLAFKTENDVKNWISLLTQTENAFEKYAKFEREVLIPAGYVRSIATYKEIAEQCESMTALEDNGQHFLYGIFLDKLEDVTFLNADQKETYQIQARTGIETMIDAYKELAKQMKLCSLISTYQTEEPLAKYDEGKAYYELLFKDNASTSDDIETAYTNLTAAVNIAVAKMRELSAEVGGITLDVNMSKLALQRHYNHLKDEYTKDFPALPSSIPDATFHEVPDAMADFYNPASYFKSAVDSLSAPETIYVNEANAGGYIGFDIISHEGIPGHMLQHAYYKSTGANKLRTLLGFTGYAEGWASYAQFYSAKYFVGEPDLLKAYQLKCLEDKASLYLTTMIDIQINYYGKTLSELKKNPLFANVTEELYNYIVQNPAVYASYGYGNYKMEQLRGTFRGTDLEFHTAVLSAGPTTYEILAQYVLED